MIRSASWTECSGERKNGFAMTPFSERFTQSTISACLRIGIFLWMMPTPPSRAMAMAMLVSVTVSIAEVISGIFSRIFFVRRVSMLTSFGSTFDSAGISRTSSNVSPSFTNFSDAFAFSIAFLHLLFSSRRAGGSFPGPRVFSLHFPSDQPDIILLFYHFRAFCSSFSLN